MQKINKQKAGVLSKNAFEEILSHFNKYTFCEQSVDSKKTKALELISETALKATLERKNEFYRKIFGNLKNYKIGNLETQSEVFVNLFYLAIVDVNINKKYEMFLRSLKNRSVAEFDLIATVNNIYGL